MDAHTKKCVNLLIHIQKSVNVLNAPPICELIDAPTKKSGNLLRPCKKVWKVIDAHTKRSGNLLMPLQKSV